MSKKPVCVVVGVGVGNGASFVRRFAKEGYAVAMIARSGGVMADLAKEIADAKAYECDVANVEAVSKTFGQIQTDLGDVEVMIYNAGSGSWGSVEEISAEAFEDSWRTNTLGAFASSKAVIPTMRKAGKGNIVFIGATASRRGNVKTAAFAPAKAAQRSLAESMARTLWPAGIHVSIIIVDGVIDLPRTRKMMSDKPDSFFMKPDDIANVVWSTTQQNPSAWSFEVEARPFAEKW